MGSQLKKIIFLFKKYMGSPILYFTHFALCDLKNLKNTNSKYSNKSPGNIVEHCDRHFLLFTFFKDA